MNPDSGKDFESNMQQLIHLIKKMLVSPAQQQPGMPDWESLLKGKNVNLNFCFFSFFPMNPEDMEELEEIYENYLMDEEKRSEDLSMDLNSSDVDFLRRHGIQF